MSLIIFETKNIYFAIDVNYINEIINIIEIKNIEESFIDGVFNYHSKNIPLIEVTKLFNCFHGEYNIDSIIIVIKKNNLLFGLLADNIINNYNSTQEFSEDQKNQNNYISTSFNLDVTETRIVHILNLNKIEKKISFELLGNK
ncbi:MAG: chemotaxis protein CheW [Candidatus Sericytochromatia bacterium]